MLEALLEADAALDVDHVDLAVAGGDVGLAMSLVLQDLLAVDLVRLEDTLVHDHELAIQARVDLEILRCLDADGRIKLVVEGIYCQVHLLSVRWRLLVLIEDLLPVVGDEALSIDPEPVASDRQDAVTHLLLGVGACDDLQRGKVADIPHDGRVHVVQSEDKRPSLAHIERCDRMFMPLQAA